MANTSKSAAVTAKRDIDASEPLLPIEQALIGWGLIVGFTLLMVLAAASHILPVN